MKDSVFKYFHDISRSLGRAKARNFLIVLAVGSGTFAYALLLGIRAGLEERAMNLLADFGADTARIQVRRSGESLLGEPLIARLRGEFPDMIFSGERSERLSVQGLGTISFLVADADWMKIRPHLLQTGRALDREDVRAASPFAVVCRSFGLRPGAVLRLDGLALTVVGTAELEGRIQVVPRFKRSDAPVEPPFEQLLLRGGEIEAVHTRLTALYPDAQSRLSTPGQLLRETRRWQKLVLGGFGAVAGLFFLLGGSALMSVMMLSVQQRRSEIGLRMALGAGEGDIFALFLGEGLVLSLLAGLAGVILSVCAVSLPVLPPEVPFLLHGNHIWLPVLFSVLIGSLFTCGPALHAAAQSPADVLRPE